MHSECSWYFNISLHIWQKRLNFDIAIIAIIGNNSTQSGSGGEERVRPFALPPPPCMVPVFHLNIYFREQTLVLMMKMIALLPSTVIRKHFTFKVCLLIVVRLCMIWTVEWCEIIVNREHQKYFWNVIVVQEKSQSGLRKLNRKQEH